MSRAAQAAKSFLAIDLESIAETVRTNKRILALSTELERHRQVLWAIANDAAVPPWIQTLARQTLEHES